MSKPKPKAAVSMASVSSSAISTRASGGCVGVMEPVGAAPAAVGEGVGATVGNADGALVGAVVGRVVGLVVGLVVGDVVGLGVGLGVASNASNSIERLKSEESAARVKRATLTKKSDVSPMDRTSAT